MRLRLIMDGRFIVVVRHGGGADFGARRAPKSGGLRQSRRPGARRPHKNKYHILNLPSPTIFLLLSVNNTVTCLSDKTKAQPI